MIQRSFSRRALLGGVASAAIVQKANAGYFPSFCCASNLNAPAWQILKIGAGGEINILNVTDNGNGTDCLIVGTDYYSCYIWNSSLTSPKGNDGSTGAFQDLMNTSSMPAGFVENAQSYGHGQWGIAAAPSNPQILYATNLIFPNDELGLNKYPKTGMYKSTNQGSSWTELTGFTPVNTAYAATIGGTDGNNAWRFFGQRIAVDPFNPNICYVGFADIGGAFVTTDGGSTWNAVTNLPAGAASTTGICGFIFDPHVQNSLYVFTSNSASPGVYHSTNSNLGASSAWTNVSTGGPAFSSGSYVMRGDITPTTSKVYYVVNTNGSGQTFGSDLWSYNGSTWTHEIAQNAGAGLNVTGVACDPANSSHVIALVSQTGNLQENNGSGWSASSLVTQTYGDIVWPGSSTLNAIGIAFSKNTSGKLYCHDENDFFTTQLSGPISGSTTVSWTSQGRGLEGLISNCITCGVSANPAVGGWDHVAYETNTTTYPTTFQPGGPGSPLNICWSMDHAKFVNTSFVAAISDGSFFGTANASFFSTDNLASCTLFSSGTGGVTLPPGVYNGSTGNAGGCMAVSDPSNFIWAPNGGVQPFFTLNGGVSWMSIDLSAFGVVSWTGFQGPTQVHLNNDVAADYVTQNMFYLYFDGQGLFRTANGGTSWTKDAAAPPAGLFGIKSVPGQGGHIWGYSAGNGQAIGSQQPSGNYPATASKLYYYDGTTWTQVQNIENCTAIGFGAPAPSQSYPAVYAANGWALFQSTSSLNITSGSVGTNQTLSVPSTAPLACTPGTPICVRVGGGGNFFTGKVVSCAGTTLVTTCDYVSGAASGTSWTVGAYGLFMNTGGESATPTWQQIGPWPQNTYGTVACMAGDPSIFGQVYIGTSGFKFYGVTPAGY